MLAVKYVVAALFLALPLLLSGSAHMLVVRRNWFGWLKTPIHLEWFGENKTWRGVAFMTLASIPGVWVTQHIEPYLGNLLLVHLDSISPVVLGSALGFAWSVAELPNSYWKRRQGIAPGVLPDRHRFVHMIVDQGDSALGCAIVYALLATLPWGVFLMLVFLGPAIHLVANLLLFAFGLRKHPV